MNGFSIIIFAAMFLLPVAQVGAETTIEQILDITPFTQKDWENIKHGGTARASVAGASTRDISVGIACLLDNDQANPPDAIRELRPMLPERFIAAFGVLPPLADKEIFNEVTLGDDAIKEAHHYSKFKGGFGLNLSKQEIELFQGPRSAKGSVLNQFYSHLKQQLSGRLSAYRKEGLAGMPPYDRGKGETTNPADELRTTLDQAKPLQRYLPELYQIWVQYPSPGLKNGREYYLWSIVKLDNRPSIILSHRIELDLGERQVIAERYFYSSRFINDGFALSAIIPIQEGRLFFYVYRVWIDEWTSFPKTKQSAGQKMMIKHMEAYLKNIGICRSK